MSSFFTTYLASAPHSIHEGSLSPLLLLLLLVAHCRTAAPAHITQHSTAHRERSSSGSGQWQPQTSTSTGT